MLTFRNAFALLAIALCLGGCIKSNTKIKIAADGTATMETSNRYNKEAIDGLMKMVESMAEQAGEEMDPEATKGLDEMKSEFTLSKAEADLKALSVEVTESKKIDEGGWAGYSLKAKIADINKYASLAEKKAKEKKEKAESEAKPDQGFGMQDFGDFSPRFFKTSDPKIGKVVLLEPIEDPMAAFGESPLGEIDEMPEEMREMITGMMEGMKAQFMGNDMETELEVELPGKITGIVGGKKKGEKTIVLSFKGQDLNLDALPTMFGMAKGVSATFEIPEGCKIQFQDADAEKKKKEEKKEEKKSGGIKIGG